MAISTTRPVVFISGANTGIGRATATILASKFGYHVIIGSRNLAAGEKVASELQAAGHSASAVQLDLSSEASINAAVKSIELEFGHLDVLINNAGILTDLTEAGRKLTTFDLFSQIFTTNVIGTAALTDALLPLLHKAVDRPARLVFLSSAMGSLELTTDKTMPWYPLECKAYDSSKAAVNMLMLNYVRVLDGSGIKVNSVCPGLVKTNLTLFDDNGVAPEVGAQRVVELATLGEDGPNGTFSNSQGPLPW